ncbi:MAG: redoxin domain-containing protein [Chloroflexota bacterium]|nr:redoxin domain-containing protein [Chloroflexota bacterium]
MKKGHFIGISAAIVTMSLVWILLTPVLFPANASQLDTIAPHAGFMAPDFTLSSPEEEMQSLSDYRGKPVLVFLWASWCSVCKRAMPGLQSVYEDYAVKGFEILAVNTTFQDTLTTAINTFQSEGYTYQLLLDRKGSVAQAYRLYALPTAILVGSDGRVLDVVIGSGISEGYLRSRLDDIFEGSK